MAPAVAADDDPFDAVRAAKHSPGEINASLFKQLSDSRRADPLAAKLNFRNLVGEKAEFFAHLAKQVDIAAAILAKRKALAEINLSCMQTVVNYFVQEIICGLR